MKNIKFYFKLLLIFLYVIIFTISCMYIFDLLYSKNNVIFNLTHLSYNIDDIIIVFKQIVLIIILSILSSISLYRFSVTIETMLFKEKESRNA